MNDLFRDSTRRIFIIATNNCNLRCRYCYESDKNSGVMDVESIKSALEKDIENHSSLFSDFVISFHGGEPFLAFNRIKEVCEWIWNRFNGISITINATSNGTILNPAIKEWLIANRDRFYVILSIDGSPESHNINRDNSFERIEARFFTDNWKNQGVKMTVTPETIGSLFDNFTYLSNMGFYPNPAIAADVDWDTDRDIPTYKRELSKLIDFYVENKNISPESIFNIPIHKYSPKFKTNSNGFCGVSETTIAYDINGNRYPCHTFISDMSTAYDINKIVAIEKKIAQRAKYFADSDCGRCFFSVSCSPCFGINHSKRGDMFRVDKSKCEFTKASIVATAQLYAKILYRKEEYLWIRDKNPREILHIALGTKKILDSSKTL